MGHLDGRVVIVTGAGRGVGREHALLMAAEGASVVVNDLGGNQDGTGADVGPAQEVVDEITAAGGTAIANGDSVADWEGAQRMINAAIETFGDLHAVVNNAGILRDRMLVNMTEEEFDLVVDVHLKGTFLMMRHAAAYWRERTKAGEEVKAAVVNTSSTSGLHSNPGQTNYAAAKSGIATMSIVAAQELGRYGVRVNAIAPSARTRMTLATPGLGERIAAPEDGSFDKWDPAHISPLVAWLCTEDCPATAQVYWTGGNQIARYLEWSRTDIATTDGRWEIDEVDRVVGGWETDHVRSRSLRVTGTEEVPRG
jgi:NAD(P)-dependent dehydrogenase (short-subunit alcohol dehydrogenase family)